MCHKKLLNHILIIKDNGLPIYTKSFECPKTQNQENIQELLQSKKFNVLFSGFISAITSLGEDMKIKIKYFTINNNLINFYHYKSIIGIVVNTNSNSEKVRQLYYNNTKLITKMFYQQFKNILHINTLAVNSMMFNSFQAYLEHKLILNESASKKKECWDHKCKVGFLNIHPMLYKI